MLSKELFVPGSMDDLSSEWLQMALADSFPRSRFTSLSRERIGEAFGFASQIYRCGWQEGNSRQSVVVKLWSTDSKAGVQEALFYRSFKGIGIRIPQYHYSAINEKNNKAVLVLEDLMDAVQGAILSPLDLNRAKNIALMIARMHGTWLSRPKRSDYPWLPESSDWNQTPAWLVSRKMECVKRFDKYLMGFSRQLLGKMELAPEVANERLATAPATLCHDDFHLDNIMFERQSEPVLLDWSNPVLGPSAYNLVDLLLYMIPLDYFDIVFHCYLDEFNQLSSVPQCEEDLKYQMGGALLQRFSRTTCGAAFWQPSSARGLQLLQEGIAQSCKVIAFWEMRDPELFSFAR